MAVPTVYRWDDLNAPQITDFQDASQMQAWAQAIFADGYLEDDNTTMKAGLGWSVDNTVTTQSKVTMIGNPVTEDLMELTMSSPDGAGWNAIGMKVTSNGETFIDSGGTYVTYFFGYADVGKVCPWIVVGTTRGVYFIGGYNITTLTPTIPPFSDNANSCTLTYVGNFVNDGVQVGLKQCVMGGQYSGNLHTNTKMSTEHRSHTYGFKGIRINRNYLDAATPLNTFHYEHINGEATTNYVGQSRKGLKFPYIDGKVYLKEFGMYDEIDGVYFGKMPALYYPEHDKPYATPSCLVEFDGVGEFNNDKFIGISTTSYNEMYINTSEDWGF